MYALKSLLDQPFRYVLTAVGVALCVLLMLFLLGIYRGVATGSVDYIRESRADLWILQRHATNILRSTSLLRTSTGHGIDTLEGVSSVSPIAFVLASVKLKDGERTVYLTGFDPETGRGGPPEISAGRNLRADNEIVLDEAFALKNHLSVGDSIAVKRDTLHVVGLSRRTNMIVIQYAFVTLTETHRVVGFGGYASAFLVDLRDGRDADSLSAEIMRRFPDLAAFPHDAFLRNNLREMETGILPLLFVVALLGSVILIAILSLILSINVLERRKDYALMKALGAPTGAVPVLVIFQSCLLAGSGLLIGIAAFRPLAGLVGRMAPEVSVMGSPDHYATVTGALLAISLVSAIGPILRLRNVYPMEIFR